MMDSGENRKHLSGEAAYVTFVPKRLQEVCRFSAQKEDSAWHQSEKLTEILQDLETCLGKLNEVWQSLSESDRERMGDELLKSEAENSILMAYPRKAGKQQRPAVLWEEWFQNLQETGRKTPVTSDRLLQKDTIEDIPDEFRQMAGEDTENLFQAGRKGLIWMEELPLSGRLLKEMHRIALYGRHYDKMYRGEFRTSPVWMGEAGMDLRSAEFVPPAGEEMTESFSDMEKFLHYEEEVHPLVKAALLHYQFETIHPFIDGNGRIGRMLVLLYLKEYCGLECPWIQLSESLLQGIDRYYKEIRSVQLNGTYLRWSEWFLGVLKDAAGLTLNLISSSYRP